MNMKICPNCNAEVPDVANLCKHCFHDFNLPPPKKNSPFWSLLIGAFGTALFGAILYTVVPSRVMVSNVTLDPETESFIFTTTYSDKRISAERVRFKDISAIELNRNASPKHYQIDLITIAGKHHTYAQSDTPLEGDAQRLADTSKRPLVIKDDGTGN
jgi:ribosomal protein L40E